MLGNNHLPMTYTFLIVHGCGMPNACHEIIGDKTFTLARFNPTVTVRVGEGPVSSHPGWTSDLQVYVHEEESEYASEGNSSRVSKNQVKSRRPHAAARGCTVASARQQRILHCTHMWHHIARILLTVRIARGAVSFLATYEASDVGGDVPPQTCAERLGPTPHAHGYGISMAIVSQLISLYSSLPGLVA